MKPAEEALRRQREIFQQEQRAAFLGAPSAQTTVQSPQSQRSLLKEAQMNRQDSSAAQSRAAPASTGQNYGSAAAEATFGFLNQNGVSTKYTQELSKAAQSPAAQSQTAQMGQRPGSAALEGTLGYLNQNGVSTKYTQGLIQASPQQTAAEKNVSQPEKQAFGSSGKTWKSAILQESPSRSAEEIQRDLDQAVRTWEAINPGYAVTPEQAAAMETSKKTAWEQVRQLQQEQKLLEEQQKLYTAAAENRIKKYEQT